MTTQLDIAIKALERIARAGMSQYMTLNDMNTDRGDMARKALLDIAAIAAQGAQQVDPYDCSVEESEQRVKAAIAAGTVVRMEGDFDTIINGIETGSPWEVCCQPGFTYKFTQPPSTQAEPIGKALYELKTYGKAQSFGTEAEMIKSIQGQSSPEGASLDDYHKSIKIPCDDEMKSLYIWSRNKHIEEMLSALRTYRDQSTGPIRSDYNIACDRLDVLVSKLHQESKGA